MVQISGIPASTGEYTPQFIVTDANGQTSQGTELDIAVLPPGGVQPQLFPLPIVLELYINGTWNDISDYVYHRDTINITGGKSALSDPKTAAQMTLTLNNRDGRFSPNYENGPYYPYLGRNNQIRLSLNNATSATGDIYSGYRFWGEVAQWPPTADITGADVYCQITANGPNRRINKGGGIGSALDRYYASLVNPAGQSFGPAPIAYWACEEDPLTTQIGSGVEGSENMIVASGNPIWKASPFSNGSAPLPVVNRSIWTGVTSTFGTSGDDQFLDPGTYNWVASTSTVNVTVIGGGGGATKGQTPTGGGAGGGGGESAVNASVAVTPGQIYQVVVGAGGQSGNYDTGGNPGGQSSFAGDSLTLIAKGGGGAGNNGSPGGSGGTGGNAGATGQTFNGGHGGTSTGGLNAGGGGGGSGGTRSAGNNGANASSGTPGQGGAAVTGGGKGGTGGYQTDGNPGRQPGGGGGGGWANNTTVSQGGAGAPGSVRLVYQGSQGGTTPPANVVRFLMQVPPHGGNNFAVLVRALGNGTIAKLDCQYRTGGIIRMFGYLSNNSQVFDSGGLNVGADGSTLLVSMEMTQTTSSSGFPAVDWSLSAIQPGASGVVAKVSGTYNPLLTAANIGSVSEIIVDPNSNVSKTALGHISVQYALVPLWQVSKALDGNQYEAGPERFIRLATEQNMGSIVEWNEENDHWGFETGTQNWVPTNCTISSSTYSFNGGSNVFGWPTDGTHSLKIIPSGSGQPSVVSPTGLNGQPCVPGDVVSVSADILAFGPTIAPTKMYLGIQWFDISGAFISESDCSDTPLNIGQPTVLRLIGAEAVAPAVENGASANAQFFAVVVGDHETLSASSIVYVDNVRVSPHMGPQQRHAMQKYFEEIEDLDQGIIKEAKELWGFKMRTRLKIINQSPAVNLDYTGSYIQGPLAPVEDDKNTKNDIVVHRHKGSKVEVVLSSGAMSILEPPQGVGKYRRTLKVVAAADEQLAALAAQLLTIGTASNERYPQVSINMMQASVLTSPLANMMSACAGVEMGDMIELDNLPFWLPSQTSQQMVIGYSETLSSDQWIIQWNCTSYAPYVQVTTSLRRW